MLLRGELAHIQSCYRRNIVQCKDDILSRRPLYLLVDLQLGQAENGVLLLLRGLLLVLLQLLVALGDAPGVWPGQRGTVGPPAGRLQLLPVLALGTRTHPRLGVHHQTGAPEVVLLGAGGQAAPLLAQLLRDGPDVVGLESAAAADVADPQVVGLPCVLVHVPPEEGNIDIKE